MATVKVNEANFENEVVKSEIPVLVDFYADWCGPCRMVAPVLEEIADERTDIKVCKINVDEASALAIKFGVESIPTLLVFKNGAVSAKAIGARPKSAILEMLDK